MEFSELKKQSHQKILLRGKSGYGKTMMASGISLRVSSEGGRVLYVDTEAEGSTTMVKLIEEGQFSEEDVDGLDYVQVADYDELMEMVSPTNQASYDLVVVDTLDSKHTFALQKVTNSELASDADWNQYPEIYSREKQVMEALGKPRSNILACLDPESGKMDKPKGAQTNVHGYFGIVLDMMKDSEDWYHQTRNYVGWGEAIGKKIPDVEEKLAQEILERSER